MWSEISEGYIWEGGVDEDDEGEVSGDVGGGIGEIEKEGDV